MPTCDVQHEKWRGCGSKSKETAVTAADFAVQAAAALLTRASASAAQCKLATPEPMCGLQGTVIVKQQLKAPGSGAYPLGSWLHALR